MQPYEPDFIVANCPGCAMFMDKWQYTISRWKAPPTDRTDTVFRADLRGTHGTCPGYDPWEIGLQMHQVSGNPCWIKWGILYDPEAKFKTSGERTSGPEMPHVPESLKIIMLNHKIGKRIMKSFIFNFQFSIFN